ncbi:retrovirus-related pol polyprotein from transposon TNT 1-94 [Tanacetum coccineum]
MKLSMKKLEILKKNIKFRGGLLGLKDFLMILELLLLRNKTDLDTISMDDVYNNLKVYVPEVKGISSSSSSTQNMAFMSSSNNNNSSTNGAVSTTQAVNTANGVVFRIVCDDYFVDFAIITTFTRDDSRRFTWVFFLATKDETSGILKSFITGIENLVDHKVKVIRCDNGTEFKNREMNQFCEIKGILRQFSVARTPQQNGVAKRRNRTLIKAARTMLADSKLPTTFWAEAVNTACYVQNRVLVVKPHNKTPYELFHGRTPTLSFMRPFGCPVTILNTIDHLGKFDGKADEGFFVGYSLNSKAFRVFNSRTRIVEENLHIRFSESTPNVVGTQSNGFAGIKLIPPNSQDPKRSHEMIQTFNTNNVNATSTNEVNVVSEKPSIELLDDPNMAALEDYSIFDFTRNDEDNGVVADMNNLDTTIQVSPIPTTRIHKDHPLDQVIGDLQSATQTRNISKNLKEHGFVSTIQQRTNHKDLQNCLFACFLSQEEPKKTLVDLPNGKRAIGTKWVFRNKKDERRIVIRNKARLVAQGYTQEEGSDYDEVFSPVAIIEAIRLFLAYASFKYFVVYQMDVKSVFLYEKIEEEVYVCQPPRFEDPDFPDRVYKVEKALCGLHQAHRAWYETFLTYLLDDEFQRGKIDKTLFIKRHKGDILLVQMSSMGELTFFLGLQVQQKKDGIFISQDKYVGEILKKFGFTEVKTASTPMETQKPLLKDEDGEEVDVYMYRSMIGSLMYLTSSRPDIMFAVCACARYQVNLKVSHLHAVKRIFSDYARASLDRKSTIGGCQFLRSRLISWQCKKQTVVANSITEAEYVAASSCCGQVLWIQNQLLDYGSKTTAWNEFSSTMASSIICLATNQKFNFSKYIFESMVKNLDNAGSFFMYPRFVQVFLDKQLEGMPTHNRIYIASSHTKKIFGNIRRVGKGFSGRETPLLKIMVVQAQAKMGEGSANPTEPHHTPTIIQPSTSQPQKKQRPRKSKRKDTQIPQSSGPTDNVADKAVNEEMDDSLERAATTATSLDVEFENISKTSNDPLLARGNTLQSGEDSLKLNELKELCINLQQRVLDLETTKTTQANEIASLKRRVKKLERRNKSRTHRLKRMYIVGLSRRVESSEDEDLDDADMFDVNDLHGDEVIIDNVDVVKTAKETVNAATTTTTTTTATITDVEITLAQRKQRLREQNPNALRAEDKRNRPPTRAQQRSIMCTYLKNMEGWKPKNLKHKSFANIQELFDKAMKRVNTFVNYKTELVEKSSKKAEAEIAQESNSKRAGDEFE